MAEDLTDDDDERKRYVEAFENGCRFQGYTNPTQRVLDEVLKHLGLAREEFLQRLLAHLKGGGRLSKVTDKRRDQNFEEIQLEFHYDMEPELCGQTIYVETRFRDADKLDDREIWIVSVHPPNGPWK